MYWHLLAHLNIFSKKLKTNWKIRLKKTGWFHYKYEFEAKINEIQEIAIEAATEAAIAEMQLRRNKERFVIFKNIPDNNNEECNTQFIANLLKN